MGEFKAKVKSFGFRDTYWEPDGSKNCIATNVTLDELKSNPELLNYFIPINDKAKNLIELLNKKNISEVDNLKNSNELVLLQESYFAKFKEQVPVNKKNNIDWIKNKLAE